MKAQENVYFLGSSVFGWRFYVFWSSIFWKRIVKVGDTVGFYFFWHSIFWKEVYTYINILQYINIRDCN